MAVCSQIHTKHINTVCGQNVELLNVELVVHIVTTDRYRINSTGFTAIIFRAFVSSFTNLPNYSQRHSRQFGADEEFLEIPQTIQSD